MELSKAVRLMSGMAKLDHVTGLYDIRIQTVEKELIELMWFITQYDHYHDAGYKPNQAKLNGLTHLFPYLCDTRNCEIQHLSVKSGTINLVVQRISQEDLYQIYHRLVEMVTEQRSG
jgi:hypothetical protein